MMDPVTKLDLALRRLAPILGVSVRDWADRATWRIDFAPTAREAERAAARAFLATFDPTAPEHDPPAPPDLARDLEAIRRALIKQGLLSAAQIAAERSSGE